MTEMDPTAAVAPARRFSNPAWRAVGHVLELAVLSALVFAPHAHLVSIAEVSGVWATFWPAITMILVALVGMRCTRNTFLLLSLLLLLGLYILTNKWGIHTNLYAIHGVMPAAVIPEPTGWLVPMWYVFSLDFLWHVTPLLLALCFAPSSPGSLRFWTAWFGAVVATNAVAGSGGAQSGMTGFALNLAWGIAVAAAFVYLPLQRKALL